MPVLTLAAATGLAGTDDEEFTFTTTVSTTFRLWTLNARVRVVRVLVAGTWEDEQEVARGHTPKEVFDFASPAGANWKFIASPHRDETGAIIGAPQIYLEAFA